MNKIALKTVVWKEGKHYVSLCINTGISSFGESKKEALTMLKEALELYFEDVPYSEVTKVERLDVVPLTLQHA